MDEFLIKREQQVAGMVPCVEINNQILLFNQSRKGLLLLNETGTLIWNLYRQGTSTLDIASSIQKAYQIESGQIVDDVNRFIDQCRLQGLFDLPANRPDVVWGERISADQPGKFKQRAMEIIYGYQIARIEFDMIYSDQALADKIHPLMVHIQSQVRSPQLSFRISDMNGYYSIESNYSGSRMTRLQSIDEVIESIQVKITDLCYRGGDWLTVLHAAAVGINDDEAIIFIAPRGHGKSTLTALLQNHGFTFLCDDVAPVDKKGLVRPLPLCQRIKPGSWELIHSLQPQLQPDIHTRSGGHDVRYLRPLTVNKKHWQKDWKVGAVIYPHYQETVLSPEFESLGLLQSLQYLCASDSVFGGAMDTQHLQTLVNWLQATPTYKLNYSQVNDTVVELIKGCV